jgi:hypothetical protein
MYRADQNKKNDVAFFKNLPIGPKSGAVLPDSTAEPGSSARLAGRL